MLLPVLRPPSFFFIRMTGMMCMIPGMLWDRLPEQKGIRIQYSTPENF